MRRRLFLMTGLIAMAAVAPQVADAQFALSPRGIFGAVTAPLRGMLRHFPHPSYHHRRGRAAESAGPPPEQDRSKLGRAGPLAWPGAYEDVVGYAFWPDDYGKPYRQHGFGDIVATLVGPLEAPAPAVSEAARRPETTGSNDANTAALPGCDDGKPPRDNWPAAQIAQTIELTPPQHAALDTLQAAVAKAGQAIKAGCRDPSALPPGQRLDAMTQQLWAVQNAGLRIRAPLKAFTGTLTDTQKAKFGAPAQDERDNPGDRDGKPANDAMGRLYQACAAQAADGPDHLVRQIQQRIRPTRAQRASLEALGKTSGDMAKLLMAACAQPVPASPLARLDAADNRLTTINYAATTLEVALNDFYSGLTDAQKKRFDSLGR